MAPKAQSFHSLSGEIEQGFPRPNAQPRVDSTRSSNTIPRDLVAFYKLYHVWKARLEARSYPRYRIVDLSIMIDVEFISIPKPHQVAVSGAGIPRGKIDIVVLHS